MAARNGAPLELKGSSLLPDVEDDGKIEAVKRVVDLTVASGLSIYRVGCQSKDAFQATFSNRQDDMVGFCWLYMTHAIADLPRQGLVIPVMDLGPEKQCAGMARLVASMNGQRPNQGAARHLCSSQREPWRTPGCGQQVIGHDAGRRRSLLASESSPTRMRGKATSAISRSGFCRWPGSSTVAWRTRGRTAYGRGSSIPTPEGNQWSQYDRVCLACQKFALQMR